MWGNRKTLWLISSQGISTHGVSSREGWYLESSRAVQILKRFILLISIQSAIHSCAPLISLVLQSRSPLAYSPPDIPPIRTRYTETAPTVISSMSKKEELNKSLSEHIVIIIKTFQIVQPSVTPLLLLRPQLPPSVLPNLLIVAVGNVRRVGNPKTAGL